MTKEKENFFKRKPTIIVFVLIALISGVMFLDQKITGNVILSNYHDFNVISFIGILLIACSVILVGYYAHKHK